LTKPRRKSRRKPLTAKDHLKLAIAKQLGLLEQVRREGWGSLSAKECGQVGGILSRMLKREQAAPAEEKALGNTGRS